MKKIIKRIVITLLIIAAIIGGIFGAYKYNRSNKVAKVCSASMYIMTDYAGDGITSYGTVASDSAQTIFLTKDQKIKEIKVAEGDEVKKGDVVLTVESATVDVKGKSLEVKQAEQRLKVSQIKLSRLEKTTPAVDKERINIIEAQGSREYVSQIEYFATELMEGYSAGDKFAVVQFDKDGKALVTTYYDSHNNEITAEEYKGPELMKTETSYYTIKETKDKFTWLRKIEYLGWDGSHLGHDVFDENGKQLESYDLGEGLTATQLQEEIVLASADVAKQDLSLRKMKLELKQMEESAGSGEIKATVDGKVTKLQEQNNINYNSSFITITGTDTFFIEGAVGEFYLDAVHVGDKVNVSSWENGASTEAEITSISDIPTESGSGYSDGNTNTSSYAFRASFDVNSGIELGSAVDINITPSGTTSGVYLYSAFIRTDKTGSYAMVMDADTNKLKRINLETGKKLWGYYSEIKSEFPTDCYIAFPYGPTAIEGANCEIVDYLY